MAGVDEESAVIATITLPGVELSVAHARRFARELLGLDHPSLDDIELCVSEAFTNGVQHTASGRGGKVTVRIRAQDGAIVTEVTDDGAGGVRPHLRNDPVGLSGRGMRIINAVTQSWGLHSDGERTTIWMRFPGPRPSPELRRSRFSDFRATHPNLPGMTVVIMQWFIPRPSSSCAFTVNDCMITPGNGGHGNAKPAVIMQWFTQPA